MERLTRAKLGHCAPLDGLRGVAVLAVVGVHYGGEWRWLLRGGGLGVNVFFVLSGFLITRLMIEEVAASGSLDLRSFYRRRVARLLPALALLITLVLVLEYGFGLYGDRGAVTSGAVSSALYIHNWVKYAGVHDPAFGFTWSLAVEEQFYMVWPVVFIVVLRRFGIGGVRVMSGGLVVIGATESLLRSVVWGHSSEQLKYATDTNGMIGLMIGCFVAATFTLDRVERSGVGQRLALAASGSVAIVVAALIVGDPTGDLLPRGGYLVISVATAVIMLALIRGAIRLPMLTSPAVVWVGQASYGIYLFHLPALFVAYELTGEQPMVARAVAFVGTLGFAAASLRWYERPLRTRLAVRRADVVADLRVLDVRLEQRAAR
jgi:peptidoglycan/LPS O-acetylase OafA/YrhL